MMTVVNWKQSKRLKTVGEKGDPHPRLSHTQDFSFQSMIENRTTLSSYDLSACHVYMIPPHFLTLAII